MKNKHLFLWAFVAITCFGSAFAVPSKPIATVERKIAGPRTVHSATFFYEQDAKRVIASQAEKHFSVVLPSEDALNSFAKSNKHSTFLQLPSWNPLFKAMSRIASSIQSFNSSTEAQACVSARIEIKDTKKTFLIICDLAKSDLAIKPVKISAVVTVFGASSKPFMPLMNVLQAVVSDDPPPFRHWGKVYFAVFATALAEGARLVIGSNLDEIKNWAKRKISFCLGRKPSLKTRVDAAITAANITLIKSERDFVAALVNARNDRISRVQGLKYALNPRALARRAAQSQAPASAPAPAAVEAENPLTPAPPAPALAEIQATVGCFLPQAPTVAAQASQPSVLAAPYTPLPPELLPVTGKPIKMRHERKPIIERIREFDFFLGYDSQALAQFEEDAKRVYDSIQSNPDRARPFLDGVRELLRDVDCLEVLKDLLQEHGLSTGRHIGVLRSFVRDMAPTFFTIVDNYGYLIHITETRVQHSSGPSIEYSLKGLPEFKALLERLAQSVYSDFSHLGNAAPASLLSSTSAGSSGSVWPVTRQPVTYNEWSGKDVVFRYNTGCATLPYDPSIFASFRANAVRAYHSVKNNPAELVKFRGELEQLLCQVDEVTRLAAPLKDIGQANIEAPSQAALRKFFNIVDKYGYVIALDGSTLELVGAQELIKVLYDFYTKVCGDLAQQPLSQEQLLAQLRPGGRSSFVAGPSFFGGCGAPSAGFGSYVGAAAGSSYQAPARRAPAASSTGPSAAAPTSGPSLAGKITAAFCQKLDENRIVHIQGIGGTIQDYGAPSVRSSRCLVVLTPSGVTPQAPLSHICEAVDRGLSVAGRSACPVLIFDLNDLGKWGGNEKVGFIPLPDWLRQRKSKLDTCPGAKIVIVARDSDVRGPNLESFCRLKSIYGDSIRLVSGNDVNAMANEVYSFVCPPLGK